MILFYFCLYCIQHWGMVCPAETPEGHAVGLVKNLSLMSHVSVGKPEGSVLYFLDEWGTDNLEHVSCKDISRTSKIFVNGNWIGVHYDPDELVRTLRKLRRNCQIDSETAIIRDIKEQEVRIYTDVGRICRPLFVVGDDQKLVIKKNHILKLIEAKRVREDEISQVREDAAEVAMPFNYQWGDLLKDGLIELIDTEEEETAMIAMKPTDLNPRDKEAYSTTFTHCEVGYYSMIMTVA